MELQLLTSRKILCALGAGLLTLFAGAGGVKAGEYIRPKLIPRQVDAKANALLKQMTLREKVRMMAFENILDVPGVPPMVHDVKRLNLYWEYPGELPRHVGPGFTAQWVTEIKPSRTGDYMLKFFCRGNAMVFLNRKKIIEQWRPRPRISFMDDYHLVKGHTYQLVIEVQPAEKHGVMLPGKMKIGLHRLHYPLLTAQQRREIKSADVVITCVGYGPRLEHEDFDRSYPSAGRSGRPLRANAQRLQSGESPCRSKQNRDDETGLA